MSIVPLILNSYSSDGTKVIQWKNPAPCSYRWCRPFRLYYEKELDDFVQEVMTDVKKEIEELKSGNFNGLAG